MKIIFITSQNNNSKRKFMPGLEKKMPILTASTSTIDEGTAENIANAMITLPRLYPRDNAFQLSRSEIPIAFISKQHIG